MKTSLKSLALVTLTFSSLAWLPMGCTQMASSNSNEYSHDADLTARVMSQLQDDDDLRVAGVKAETSQGIVTLTGTVRSEDIKERAARLAGRVMGVQGVKSAIVVQ